MGAVITVVSRSGVTIVVLNVLPGAARLIRGAPGYDPSGTLTVMVRDTFSRHFRPGVDLARDLYPV